MTEAKVVIQLVEDDPGVRRMLSLILEDQGYTVHAVTTVDEAKRLFKKRPPDLIILDLSLPGLSGNTYLEFLRKDSRNDHIPVIVLSATSEQPQRYLAFREGATDFVVKPFDSRELELKIRAFLRLSGRLVVTATLPQAESTPAPRLTKTETVILEFLKQRAGSPVPPDDILEHALQYVRGTGSSELVRSHIRNIRQKIEQNPAIPVHIVTLPGQGYMYQREDNRE